MFRQFYTGGVPGMGVNLRQPEVGCFANILAQPAAAAAILHVPYVSPPDKPMTRAWAQLS